MTRWNNRGALGLVAVCFALSGTLHAQAVAPAPAPSGAVAPVPGSPGERMATDAARAAGESRESRDPLLQSGARSARPQLTAIATTVDKKAKGQFGINRQLALGTLQLFAAASTPLSENTQPTTRTVVADLSDLPGVSSGEFGATFTYWRAPSRANRDAAAARYVAAQKKVYDELQRQIDAKEALRPSAVLRKAENDLNSTSLKRLDDALKATDAIIVARSAIAYDPATPAPARAAAQMALSAAIGEHGVQLSAREVEQQRHTKRMAEIVAAHAAVEAPLDAEIAALKRRQEPFKQEPTGKIVVLLNANPEGMRDPAYDQLVGADLEEIQRLTRSSTPLLVGISGSAGRKKYGYVDSTTLTTASQAITAQQVRVAAGILASAGFLNGYYSRQRSATERDQVQLCSPIGSTGTLRCSNARLGAPVDTWKSLVGLEFRGPLGPSLMFAIEGTRDLTNKITGWNVPFYFMTDKPGGALNGGIVFGGQTGQNGFTVKVFVGAAAPPQLH